MGRHNIESLVNGPKNQANTGEIPGIPSGIDQKPQDGTKSAATCVSEDLTRARRALKAEAAAVDPANKAQAADLAAKLDYASRGDDPPQTPASSGYMDVHRSAIRDRLPEFLRSGSTEVYAFSILTGKGEMSIDQLNAQDAVEINERLRADLKRCGATGAEGIEILEKPRPAYTEEARRLRVEGTVQLRVVFSASGQLHVVSVVKGLGHGLDEAAVRAAEAIRFRPARREGRPVDAPALIQIQFQIA